MNIVKVIAIMGLVFTAGCAKHEYDEKGHLKASDAAFSAYSVVTVNANGECHEYLRWYPHGHVGGITHLPSCQYCKAIYRKQIIERK